MLRNKRGSQFVEASIAVPITVLMVLLLLRVFVFYLEIINLGVSEHEKAFDVMDSYSGIGMKVYSREAEISMAPVGLLKERLSKTLEVKAYFYNEDRMVRGKLIAKDVEE